MYAILLKMSKSDAESQNLKFHGDYRKAYKGLAL